MAKQDRFFIGPPNSKAGLQRNLRPWLINDDAFEIMNNVYVWRGRIRKRFGERLLYDSTAAPITGFEQFNSRLRVQVDTIMGGNAAGNVPGVIFKVGQSFSVANIMFTVFNPAVGPQQMLRTDGSGATATFDVANGAYDIQGTGQPNGTDVFWYPSEPVTGFVIYEQDAINNENTYAFDTQFSYQYTGGGWDRLGAPTIWTGLNSDFFWGTTWRGAASEDNILFTTNNTTADRIKYWNGAIWTTFSPILSNILRLRSCLLTIPFKDRLVFLNTVENTEGVTIGTTAAVTGNFALTPVPGGVYKIGQSFTIGAVTFEVASSTPGPQPMTTTSEVATGTFDVATGAVVITGNNENPSTAVFFLDDNTNSQSTHQNRARVTQNGSPIQIDSLRQDIVGKGIYIDAPTKEAIVTASILKDRLIVYFERSTWEFAYTGNQILPFVWQKINSELGSESTFSVINFDTAVLGVGNVGIHTCNGAYVERIDDKIPDEVFQFHNDSQGPARVHGVRDFKAEMAYWTLPAVESSPIFPTRVLVYNYVNSTWSYNEDSITAFGYFQNPSDLTWATWTTPWEESLDPWNTGSDQIRFRNVIAGNQEGYTFLIDTGLSATAQALQITDITLATRVLTVIDHNLQVGDLVYVENCVGTTEANEVVYEIVDITTIPPDATSTITLSGNNTFVNDYLGGGTIRRVTPVDMKTKQFNFYNNPMGRDMLINRVEFYVDRTTVGQLLIDYFTNGTSLGLVSEGEGSGAALGNNILEMFPSTTYETFSDQLWKAVYLQGDGNVIQFRMYETTDMHLAFPTLQFNDLQIHAMIIYAQPTRDR